MIFCLHNVFMCLICFVHFDNDKTLVTIFKIFFFFFAWLLLLLLLFGKKFSLLSKPKSRSSSHFLYLIQIRLGFAILNLLLLLLLQGSLSSIKVSSSWFFTCGSFAWLSCLKLLFKINMNLIHILCSGRTIMIYFNDARIDAQFEFSN